MGGVVVSLECRVMQCQFLRTQGGKCAVNNIIKMLLLAFFWAMDLRMGAKTNPLATQVDNKTERKKQNRRVSVVIVNKIYSAKTRALKIAAGVA